MSETQWFLRLERPGLLREEVFLICAFPVSVSVPMLKVASGAHSVIIRSTLCVDEALCQVFSIWSICVEVRLLLKLLTHGGLLARPAAGSEQNNERHAYEHHALHATDSFRSDPSRRFVIIFTQSGVRV